MKNKEIKQIINETFENNTPDLLDKIKMELKKRKLPGKQDRQMLCLWWW